MSIALRAAGSWVFGVANLTPAIPAAQVTGDMMLLIATGKPYDLQWTGPGGWTSLGLSTSGATAAGVDAGSMKLQAWYKEATSDTETNPTVTEAVPAFNVAGAIVYVLSKGASEVWETPVAVFGADEASGTSISVTFSSDPGGLGGDYAVFAMGSNSDALGPLTTDLAPSWTGIVFGSADPGIEGESTSGGDMSAHVGSRPCSSGTSSAAPAVVGTGTASGGSDKLEAVFIRLRVSAGSTPLTISDGAHAHAADNLALTQHNILAVQDALHAHAVDNIALGLDLVIQEALHGHTADGPLSLVQHHVLTVQEALHGHVADNLVLTQHNVLAIQEALHGHAADNLALVQHNILAIADALHAHGADNVVLSLGGSTLLVIQDGAHTHTVDGLVLGVGLVVADATHGHTTDGIALTQHNILAIHEALHAQTADNVVLSIPGAEPDEQTYVIRMRRHRTFGTG